MSATSPDETPVARLTFDIVHHHVVKVYASKSPNTNTTFKMGFLKKKEFTVY